MCSDSFKAEICCKTRKIGFQEEIYDVLIDNKVNRHAGEEDWALILGQIEEEFTEKQDFYQNKRKSKSLAL